MCYDLMAFQKNTMSNPQIFTSFNELLANNSTSKRVDNSPPPPTNIHESVEGKGFPNLINEINGFRRCIEEHSRKIKEHSNATAELTTEAATLKENRQIILNDIKATLPTVRWKPQNRCMHPYPSQGHGQSMSCSGQDHSCCQWWFHSQHLTFE